MPSTDTQFKKGMIPWSKSKKLPQFSGINSWRWKGGKLTDNRGYVRIFNPKHPNKTIYGYVLEHRLIMEKKIGRYLKKEEVVHHINGIKNDNRIKNLRLCKDNKEHAKLHNLRGSNNGNSKLKENQVLTIKRLLISKLTHKYIADLMGISESTVSHILNKRIWKHLTKLDRV